MEQTLIIFKPDAVNRLLVGRILARFEDKGLRIAAMKLQQSPRKQVEAHYEVHRQRPFYESLVGFMTSGPVIVAVLEGPNAINVVRTLLGPHKRPGCATRDDSRRFRARPAVEPGTRK